ncbi:hypothetical protein [Xanthobacter autotrophicus]|uniref:hypothetical protein n=1 Tax=Xanthobacter autotrophicus TaxID=280 RepID=UPI003729A745
MTEEEWQRRQGQNIALGLAISILAFFVALVMFVTGAVRIGPLEWYLLIMFVGAMFSAEIASRGYVWLGIILCAISAAWPVLFSIAARVLMGG